MQVTEASGEPVTGLTADQFAVEEDGVRMTIVSADPGTTPMKVALLIDNSEPLQAANGLSALRNSIIGFLNLLPTQHEVGIYTIAGNIQELAAFTTDRDALRGVADGLLVGSGGSRMLEGIRETWERQFDETDAWPVIVQVLTDGPETSGNVNPEQFNAFVIDLVAKGAMVHTVVLETRGGGVQTQISMNLGQNTGGMYESVNSPTALVDALADVATKMGEHFDAMSGRYRVLYERPGDEPGAQIGAGAAGNYQIQLFADRRMPEQ